MDVAVTPISRRTVLRGAALAFAGVVASFGAEDACAAPFPILPGLQLYSVHELLPKDYQGTLNELGAMGFKEVEAAGFFGHGAADVRAAMRTAGLALVSSHASFDDLHGKPGATLEFHKALGVEYVVCSSPGAKDTERLRAMSYRERMQAFTLDDYRWTAEMLNTWGQAARQQGLKLAFHNYTGEFVARGGVVPYDELLRLTDPALVFFELDWGWAEMGGGSPAAYLARYPERFPLVHLKDFKAPVQPVTPMDPPPPAELGRGTEDFHAVQRAIRASGVRHVFAEQEGYDMPPLEALRIDAEALRRLHL